MDNKIYKHGSILKILFYLGILVSIFNETSAQKINCGLAKEKVIGIYEKSVFNKEIYNYIKSRFEILSDYKDVLIISVTIDTLGKPHCIKKLKGKIGNHEKYIDSMIDSIPFVIYDIRGRKTNYKFNFPVRIIDTTKKE